MKVVRSTCIKHMQHHETEKTDVLIAGAGPVGLSLALNLAKRGIKVTVVEKNPTLNETSRAPAIWPRTQEIFAKLGVLKSMLREGSVIPVPSIWDADRPGCLLRLHLDELQMAGETSFGQLL